MRNTILFTTLLFLTSFQLTAQITNIQGGDTIRVCANEATTITAEGALSYQWSPVEIVDDPTSPMVNVTVAESQFLYVTGTLAGGITSQDSVFLLVDNTQPALSFPDPSTICLGSSITLNTLMPPVGVPVTEYQWSAIEDPSFTSNDATPTVAPTTTTTYVVTATTLCTSITDSLTVMVLTTPTVMVSEDTKSCAGDAVTLEASADMAADILWTFPNGETSTDAVITVNPLETSNYTVVFDFISGCDEIAASVLVTVEESFGLSLVTEPDTSLLIVDCEVVLTAMADTNNLTYEWSRDGEILTGENGASLAFIVDEEGTFMYEVTATSPNGCSKTRDKTLTVRLAMYDEENKPIPNIFTPNDDGTNDFFAPVLEKGIEVEEFRIFNRWGQLVYNNEDPENGWDGKFEDKPAPSDIYIYQISIRLPDGRIIPESGDVSLVR